MSKENEDKLYQSYLATFGNQRSNDNVEEINGEPVDDSLESTLALALAVYDATHTYAFVLKTKSEFLETMKKYLK